MGGDRTTEWNSWANPAYDASGNIDWSQAPDYVQQMPGGAFAYDQSGNRVVFPGMPEPAPAVAPAPVQDPRFTQGQKRAFLQNNAGNFGLGGQNDQFRYDPYGQNPKTPGTQAAIVKSLMRGR